jgi:uncharacterized protein with HEPN domain
MPPRDWRMRIQDILDSIAKIERYTDRMTLEVFSASDITIDAVVRNLEVIGEAARYIPGEIEGKYPQVPWAVMRGMRIILIHEYFGVSLRILWQTIEHNLPPLVPLLEEILASEGEDRS